MPDVYFFQDKIKLGVSRTPIRKVKTSNNTCSLSTHGLLFTLSSVFGKGKIKLAENITDKWQQLSEVISSPCINQAEVGDASIEAFILLYGEKKGTTLAKLR